MPMAQPPKPIGSTLALGFVDPRTGEFVATASLTALPTGVIEFRAIQDIPKGSVGYLPMNFIPAPTPPQPQPKGGYSTFDHS